MSARLRGIARATERIVAAGGSRPSDGREVSLTAAVEAARAGTRTRGPGPVDVPAAPPVDLRVDVTGASSLEARAERVLETPAAHGCRRLAPGAWGCGVFRNDPAQVAEAFRARPAAGGRFEHRFTHVVFGAPDRTPGGTVRAAFGHAFGRTGAQVQP
ncbi:TIGR02452 family protein [Streptomyces sp. AK04-3B]|uniref:TIGR02452 family protein n=1 Tax=Streptomyces sp. AK04-3B TaxID=3028650 RepID=UPI0029BC7CCF|nr:TIGR02452 family protein [Streptomyces sp. AK04-3B]MDX3800690.1 TIGR02452 family protein [Streptomyces sp. AK04-3B]